MARDLAGLLEEVGAGEIDLVGYSMGAVVSLIFSAGDPRVRRLVIGGVGSGIVECGGVDRRAISNEAILQALSVEDPQTLPETGARAFRALADALGSDRQALIAQASSIHRGGIALASILAPTLVLAGDRDPLAVRPQVLADAIPDARLQMLTGDHWKRSPTRGSRLRSSSSWPEGATGCACGRDEPRRSDRRSRSPGWRRARSTRSSAAAR